MNVFIKREQINLGCFAEHRKGRLKTNIMFILKSFEMGGLEVVSSVLANKFVAEGHNVSIFAFGSAEHSIESRLDKRIHTYTLAKLKYSDENVYAMRTVMLEEKTQVVINQWGLPFVPIKVARKASEGLGVKIISVYHNNPSFNGRIQNAQIAIENATNPIKRGVLALKKRIFKEITSYGMRYNYNKSDLYMVLSPSFIEEFKRFAKVKSPVHLVVQTNPVTVDTDGFAYTTDKKQKEVVYVGRLDYMQKRVSRVIDTWAIIEKQYPDWHLSIVGVGEEKENLQNQVSRLGLKNVSFEGFQQPRPYYERASLLILTSEFEGFPLVLAEAMSFGVVPTVYDSYPAVCDIIRHGENGMIVEPKDGKFSAEVMANSIMDLMTDDNKRETMAKEAIKTAQEGYSINAIYGQWMETFQTILRNGQ